MKVAVVVLNWNGEKYISETLKSVNELDIQGIELLKIVVDNDSSDNSFSLIKKHYVDWEVIVNPTNLGYAAGNNTGIRFALANKCNLVWMLNPDCLVAKDCLQKFLAAAKKYPLAGVFGCKIYFAPGYEYQKDKYQNGDLGESNLVCRRTNRLEKRAHIASWC